MISLVRKALVALAAATTLVLTMVEAPMAQLAQNPTTVVERLLEAMRAKDAPAIRTSFAVDARQQYGNGGQNSGDAFRRWLENDVIAAAEVANDETRTRYIEANGYHVFRAHNAEVFENLDGVLETLLDVASRLKA